MCNDEFATGWKSVCSVTKASVGGLENNSHKTNAAEKKSKEIIA